MNYIFITIIYMYILFKSNDSVNCINTQKMEIDFYESSGLQSILQWNHYSKKQTVKIDWRIVIIHEKCQ